MKNLGLLTIILLTFTIALFPQDRQEKLQNCYDAVNYLLFNDTAEQEAIDLTIKNCSLAIMLNLNIANLYEGRGYGYIRSSVTEKKLAKRWLELALKDLNEAVKIQPHNPRALAFRGQVRLLRREIDLAFVDLNKAVEMDTANLYALYQRALAFQQTNEKASAITDLHTILKYNPTHQKSLKLLTQLQMKPKKKN